MPTPGLLARVLLFVCLALAVATTRHTGAAPLLVAAYHFNEGSGTLLTDVSGNNNNGTLTNGPVWTAAGKFGGALVFDGTDDLVSIPANASLNLTTGMTLEAWVNPRSVSGYRTVMLKERPGQLSYSLYGSTNNGRPTIEISNPNTAEARSNAALKLTTWTHVAATYDGATLRFYTNGTQTASKATSGSIAVSSGLLRIGGNLVWGEYFNGTIDEIRIYNAALTAAQIQADMNTPIAAPPADTTPPAVSVTAPADGSTVTGPVAVSAQATDDVGVIGVQFLLNGAALGAEDTAPPYSTTWSSTAYANGLWTLSARARDAAGNTKTSLPVTVTVNNPPLLVITQPPPNATIVGTTVDIGYAIGGDRTGVTAVAFQLDGAPVVPDTTLDGLHAIFDVAEGPHTLTGWLSGSAGKIAGSDAAPVAFRTQLPDITPPTVSLNTPADGATVAGVVTIGADASDNVGVTGVQFVVDGSNLGGVDTTLPYSTSWTTTVPMNGSHVLKAVAFDLAGNQTTSAPVTVTVANTDPAALQGKWEPTMDWPVVAVHASLLPTREVLVWDGYDGPASLARLWNPQTNAMNTFIAPGDLFCGGQSLLSDGRLFVIGGHSGTETGTPETNIFDPFTDTWTRVTDMHVPRWYPSSITLPDGKMIALSGQTTGGVFADTPEIFDPRSLTWSYMSGVNTSDVHDPEYALTYNLPDGRVFVLAASTDVVRVFDPAARTWTPAPTDPRLVRSSAVMYRPGKILASGGGTSGAAAATSALVIDAMAPAPAWRAVAPMAYPRYQHNLVMLPDGTVLAVGGSATVDQSSHSGSLAAEIWNPLSETWSTMASMRDPRMYHSTALLLPDGRVLSAGGGREAQGTNYLTAQVFDPPYLFKGARPVISSAPSLSEYGSTITVATPNAADISMVSLVSLSATTHTLDMNQHFVELAFTKNAADLAVTLPANNRVVPPGYYMLFIVNGQGVPSTAAMIRLPSPYDDTQPPSPPSNLMASVSGNTVSLAWSASSDNLSVAKYAVHRAAIAGFTPSPSTFVHDSTTTSYVDAGVSGHVYYKVVAYDQAGNASGPSNEVEVTLAADTSPPSVSITAPSDGSTVSGAVTVTASATDDIGVAGVQFLVDGVNAGAEDTSAPYSFTWDTTPLVNGTHRLSARARDVAGNATTSADVTVTVSAPPVTIDFNNLTPVQAPFSGQYPAGVINWGTNVWWLSGPWGQFTTNSISFNGGAPTSGAFTFMTPKRLVSLKAFNGGTVASTITLSCAGNPTKTVSVAVNQLTTIATGWTASCTTVTIGSSNGWNTNFDDLAYTN